jgi:sulfonate transport system substrate-binding protein
MRRNALFRGQMVMTRLRSLIAAAVAAVGLLSIPTEASAADPVKIRIGWVVAPGALTTLLFDDGYRNADILKHYGKSYTVETQFFRGSTPQITALAANQTDIIQPAFSSLGYAIENAQLEDIRVIADLFQDGFGDYLTQAYIVAGDSQIRTVADLKGKTVGVNAFGGALDIAMQAMLKKNGLQINRDYRAIEVQITSMVPFLAEKKVDMIGMGMPWIEEAKSKIGGRVLFTMKDAVGLTEQIMWAARKPFLDRNKAAMNDFFEDYVRGLHWFFDPKNRTQALEIIARFNKRSVSDYESWVLTKKDYYRDPYAMPNVEALQANLDLTREMGVLKTKIDAKKYLDLSFAEEAKRRLGGGVPAGWR